MAQSTTPSSHPTTSEVAALREHIDLSEQAAERALVNGAMTAPHRFIISSNAHRELAQHLSHDEAMQILIKQFGWTAEEIAAGADPALAPQEAPNADAAC